MSEETIELRYISDYEDPETGETERNKEGVSIVSREDYLDFLQETEYNPPECGEVGCLSCFLDEKDLWVDGYGIMPSTLWFGVDPATGKQWDPEAVLASRGEEETEE